MAEGNQPRPPSITNIGRINFSSTTSAVSQEMSINTTQFDFLYIQVLNYSNIIWTAFIPCSYWVNLKDALNYLFYYTVLNNNNAVSGSIYHTTNTNITVVPDQSKSYMFVDFYGVNF